MKWTSGSTKRQCYATEPYVGLSLRVLQIQLVENEPVLCVVRVDAIVGDVDVAVVEVVGHADILVVVPRIERPSSVDARLGVDIEVILTPPCIFCIENH
jgi:hypothetical protein